MGMQTPAEAHLIRRLCGFLLQERDDTYVPSILNIGAGRSAAIERRLADCGCRFRCDRIDVEDCTVIAPSLRHAWRCSVEDMHPAETAGYDAAFANYVLEHVADLERAASEIFRVLKPGGLFVTSVPNLTAPEFVIARHAPPRLQEIMTQGKGFHTCYGWNTIDDLTGVFEAQGFSTDEVRFWALTEGYLWRYPVVGSLSRLYDKMVSAAGIKRLMGNVCICMTKPRGSHPDPRSTQGHQNVL
jgi:SAM-dependent methyltransferase